MITGKLVIVLLGITLCLAQQRPQISEQFEAKIVVEWRDHHSHQSHFGDGWIVLDQPNGKGSEWMHFPTHHELDSHRIQRYDLNKEYEIYQANKSCDVRDTTGEMPKEWAWIAQANYTGEAHFGHRKVAIWELQAGYAHVRLAVDAASPNTPVWLHRRSEQSQMHIEFVHYSVQKPHQDWFDVPSECKSVEPSTPSNLACVSRDTMISRAKVWVDHKVPYNQGGTYGGYREDCSGYVSYIWGLSKPGYTTSTLGKVSHAISKGELKPGDALLCASEHVVLFGGWTDSSHTHYTAFEETRPGEGTVKRTTPYPYWYNTGCFKPYRSNSVC